MPNTQIKIRRDTSSNWTAVNPILGSGEPALETDTLLFKFGDGVTPYKSLLYPTLLSTPTPASALTGTTLPLNVTNSSLTSVGILTGLTVNGNVTIQNGTITGTISNATYATSAGSATTATTATSAATATTITGPIGGTSNAIIYLQSNGSVGFVTTPASAGTFLQYNGTGFSWANSPAPNANLLPGSTLASNVVNSSLTSVGTITAGIWNGTAIAVANGGTGATTAAQALINLGAAPAAGSTNITTIGALTSVLTVSNTTDANSISQPFGAIVTTGGVYMAKGAYIGTTATIAGNAQGTSYSSGNSLQVAGGAGIAGTVYINGNLYIGGTSIKALALALGAAMG
jgi:hypothetical protein